MVSMLNDIRANLVHAGVIMSQRTNECRVLPHSATVQICYSMPALFFILPAV